MFTFRAPDARREKKYKSKRKPTVCTHFVEKRSETAKTCRILSQFGENRGQAGSGWCRSAATRWRCRHGNGTAPPTGAPPHSRAARGPPRSHTHTLTDPSVSIRDPSNPPLLRPGAPQCHHCPVVFPQERATDDPDGTPPLHVCSLPVGNPARPTSPFARAPQRVSPLWDPGVIPLSLTMFPHGGPCDPP